MKAEIKERIERIERGEVPEGYKKTCSGIIPNSWYEKKVKDIAEVLTGGTPDRGNADFWNGHIPWITTSLIDFNTIYATEELITEEGLKKSATRILPQNTIIMAMYGQGVTRGKVATLGIPATTNQACCAMVVSSQTFYQYVFYFLMNEYFNIRNKSNAGSQLNLNTSIIKEIKLVLGSFAEQQRIASVIYTWDRTIQIKEELLEQTKLQKQGMMERLLTGKVRLPECSKEWKLIKISELLTMCERLIKLDDDMQYEQITIRRNYGGVESRGFSAGKSILVTTQFLVRQNDFVISRRQIAHGACGVVPVELNGAIVSNEYDVFTANEELDVHFFSYLMQLPIFKYRFYVFSNGVHIEKMIFHTKTWLKSEIKLPRYEEQVKIREMLDKEQMAIDLLTKEIDQLKIQKKGLMQLLLTGKVRVSC